MSFILHPWHSVFAVFCGWVNERQQQIIEFQNAQIEALLKKLGTKRVLLTDDQRRLLGVKGHTLGRKALRELSVRELKQFVYKYICGRAPEETIVMDAMPMTVTGKVDRIRRKQMAESRLGSNASGGRV